MPQVAKRIAFPLCPQAAFPCCSELKGPQLKQQIMHRVLGASQGAFLSFHKSVLIS